jgi:hypothetical protein
MFLFMYGMFLFAPRRAVLAAVWVALVGPKIWLLFPAWVMGHIAFRASKRDLRYPLTLAIGGMALAAGLILSKFGNLYVTWRLEALIGPNLSAVIGDHSSFFCY